MSSLRLTGIEQLGRNLNTILSEMKKNLADGAKERAERVRDRAQELCPEDTGKLKDTIRVVESTTGIKQGRTLGGQFTSEAVISVGVVVGDETTPYALAVHEYPSEHNPPSWEGGDVHFTKGGPKFLENAVKEEEGLLLPYLASKVR